MRGFFVLSYALLFMLPSIGEAKKPILESPIMISNPSYKKFVHISCYFVNRERLSEAFAQEKYYFARQSSEELDGEKLYLLVKCKNRGLRTAYGTLRLKIPNRERPILIDIDKMKRHMTYTHDYVFRIDDELLLKDEKPPWVEFAWDHLYTAHEDLL